MKTWLFRPFDRIAGGVALGLGLFIIVVTAFLAAASGLHTDGVIDLHFGPTVPVWVLLLQGLINWLCLGLVLYALGRWLSTTRFRAIDLFGTQALARWPMLLGVAYMAIPGISGRIEFYTTRLMAAMPDDPSKVMASSEYLLDAIWLMVISLPVLAAIAWMIWLMAHGYALVTNLKGQRVVFSFIGGLIAAEILSKVLIHFLLQFTILPGNPNT
jgi:hypothetical protein